jgi:hypothetical protein
MLALAFMVSNCSGGSSFDPTNMLDDLFASQKKPLPGERKPLFPQGTPGIQQGVPPDLVKGYQPPSEPAAPDDTQASAKAKARPRTAAAPATQQAPAATQLAPPATQQ